MKKLSNLFFRSSLLMFACAVFIWAQGGNVSQAGSVYLISAKAGGVNYVSGDVTIQKNPTQSIHALVTGESVEAGEKIISGSNGLAEILLNPGSYARLAGNTEFTLLTNSLDDLQVELARGTAIFEIYAVDRFNLVINLPNAKVRLLKSGVYRADILHDGSVQISVWSGRAVVEGGPVATQIEKGNGVVISNGKISDQFDLDLGDNFDLWSRERSKELAKLASKLKKDQVRNILYTNTDDDWWMNQTGFWVYDRGRRTHCYVPNARGWQSPYGDHYNRNIGDYRHPGQRGSGGNPGSNPGSGSPVASNPNPPPVYVPDEPVRIPHRRNRDEEYGPGRSTDSDAGMNQPRNDDFNRNGNRNDRSTQTIGESKRQAGEDQNVNEPRQRGDENRSDRDSSRSRGDNDSSRGSRSNDDSGGSRGSSSSSGSSSSGSSSSGSSSPPPSSPPPSSPPPSPPSNDRPVESSEPRGKPKGN